MAITVAKLSKYMEHKLNIYITGEGGTGKTQMLMEAAKKAGLRVGYLSAPTLDAYVDLVGIPVAKREKKLKKRVLEFVRKQEFDEIEVLFIDELPRGEIKTLNAVFEIVQFGTINGEKAFGNLQSVVAAGNPLTDDYVGQNQLDLALLDRFDIYLESSTAADLSYFISVFGKSVGSALVNWHRKHDYKANGYLSPRRLEKIGHTWLLMPEISTIKAMVTPGGNFDVDGLHKALSTALDKSSVDDDDTATVMDKISFMDLSEVRRFHKEIQAEIGGLTPSEVAIVTDKVSSALRSGITNTVIFRDWGFIFDYFSPADTRAMTAEWSTSRNAGFHKKLAELKINLGSKLKK